MSRKSRRDESLESLLRASLGSSSREPVGECPDAEVLAAWADGALEGSQRAAARDHVADCVSCQATLAVLARTAPAETLQGAWWRVNVRWLVPIAATATAIAIWVAVPRDEYTSPPEPASSAARTTTAARPEPLAQAPSQPTAANPAGAVGNRTRTAEPRPLEEQALERQHQSRELRSEAAARNVTAADAAERRDAAPPARVRAAAEPKRDNPVAAPADGTTPQLKAEAAPASPAAAAPGAAPTAGQLSRFGVARSAAALNERSIVVSSPGTAFRWRLGPAGGVDYSADAGRTWEAQPTGVDADLVAGSSPSGTICWIVGRSGTVLLTTNGTQWRRLTPPAQVDLSAVQAANALTATVTAVDGRRFRTTDGGTSWLLQENPAAPF